MAAGGSGRRRAAGRRVGGLRSLSRVAARGGGLAGGAGVDGRIRLLRFVFIVFLVLVGGKAVALASSSENLMRIAHQQQMATVALPAQRGAILDRNGSELAVGRPAQTVFATPYLLGAPKSAARALCEALQITKKRERRALEKALARPGSGFAYVARQVDPLLATAALALDLPGVGAYAEEKRSYPTKGSAAQVLGVVDVDGKGIAGVEKAYDEQLAGVAGSEVIVRDPAGHALRTVRETQPTSGASVRLTLDEDIQYWAEDVLEQTVRASSAAAATAIVMDPRSGEILAMANAPKVEDNVFGRTPAFDRNRCVTDIYEPGSIFKLVTISGALADGLVRPKTKFTLPSSLTLYDRTINESHARGTVTYSVREILQWSSNVGAVTIGMKMGKEGLLKWMDAFGFARPTGIGFPGEAAGIVPPAKQWSGTTIINVPMGQGIAVTPIQMAAAFSTVANNGVAVKPRLIAQVGDVVYDEVQKHRVISAKVARDVRSMLATAVAEGTGMKAQIPGYEVAGKTGTAEKPLADGSGYSQTDYVASFIGMVPADHPRLVVLVAVDSPRSSIYGGDIAAPAVQKIMRFALQQLEIAP
jgi:cell division protein FtsI (penicillin-binding protein 3)/stage V sporulation protein D (sporulation-specific penicillin-binding protein)